jgi:integrase
MTAAALPKWRGRAHYIADSDFVFAGGSGKPRWQAMMLKDYIRPADRDGIGKVGWDTFRHTYRANLKRGGTPLEVQKDLPRRANVKATAEIYGLGRDLTSSHVDSGA